jgi:hypothetical protein
VPLTPAPTNQNQFPATSPTQPQSNHAFAADMALPSAAISQHLGFDKSLALASSQMATWWQSSPYYNVGFYPYGSAATHSHVNDPNLNKSWVAAVAAQGWGLIPIAGTILLRAARDD